MNDYSSGWYSYVLSSVCYTSTHVMIADSFARVQSGDRTSGVDQFWRCQVGVGLLKPRQGGESTLIML